MICHYILLVSLFVKEGLKDGSEENNSPAKNQVKLSKSASKKLLRSKGKKSKKSGMDKELDEMFKPMTEFMNSNNG